MGHLGWDIQVSTNSAKQGWDIKSVFQSAIGPWDILVTCNRPCAPQAKFFSSCRPCQLGGMPIVLSVFEAVNHYFYSLLLDVDTGSDMQMTCWDKKDTLL